MRSSGIISLVLILIIFSACAASCVRDPGLPPETAAPETSAIISGTAESPATPADSPAEFPENAVADKYLGALKTLTVTEDRIILEETLGAAKTTSISRSDCTFETTTLAEADLCEFVFKSKTGTSISINLSLADCAKLLKLLGEE